MHEWSYQRSAIASNSWRTNSNTNTNYKLHPIGTQSCALPPLVREMDSPMLESWNRLRYITIVKLQQNLTSSFHVISAFFLRKYENSSQGQWSNSSVTKFTLLGFIVTHLHPQWTLQWQCHLGHSKNTLIDWLIDCSYFIPSCINLRTVIFPVFSACRHTDMEL